MLVILTLVIFFFFFFNDTATTEIYTLSLHDALPIFLFFGQRQVLVVLFENVSDALLFCRRVKGPPRDIVDIDGLFIKLDRKSTRLNSSHSQISYAVFCLKKKKIPVRRLVLLARLSTC